VEVTTEQVCRALGVLMLGWLMAKRGSTDPECVRRVIVYHQRRNRAARRSRQKEQDQPTPRPARNVAHQEEENAPSIHRDIKVALYC